METNYFFGEIPVFVINPLRYWSVSGDHKVHRFIVSNYVFHAMRRCKEIISINQIQIGIFRSDCSLLTRLIISMNRNENLDSNVINLGKNSFHFAIQEEMSMCRLIWSIFLINENKNKNPNAKWPSRRIRYACNNMRLLISISSLVIIVIMDL